MTKIQVKEVDLSAVNNLEPIPSFKYFLDIETDSESDSLSDADNFSILKVTDLRSDLQSQESTSTVSCEILKTFKDSLMSLSSLMLTLELWCEKLSIFRQDYVWLQETLMLTKGFLKNRSVNDLPEQGFFIEILNELLRTLNTLK